MKIDYLPRSMFHLKLLLIAGLEGTVSAMWLTAPQAVEGTAGVLQTPQYGIKTLSSHPIGGGSRGKSIWKLDLETASQYPV